MMGGHGGIIEQPPIKRAGSIRLESNFAGKTQSLSNIFPF